MKQPEPPPSMLEVIQKLGPDKFVELLKNKEVADKLNEVDKDYPYWETFKRKVKGLAFEPEALWVYNKVSRGKTITTVKISDLSGFSFKFNTTTKIIKHLHEFDLHLGGALEGRSIIPTEDKNRYLISSIMEEAIASSQLEGAATTREIAKEMLRTQRKPINHSEKMILNNYLTIKRVLEIKDQKLSKELILQIHSLISKDTLKSKDNEGKFRSNNKVDVVDELTGEIFYSPPNYELIESLMDKFCEFANTENEKEFIHPIIKGIIIHFLIGYIHPFVDGNGRTARALFYWYLLSKGYWLVEYMAISKIIIRAPAQYARAYLYTEHDENDLTYFIDYNVKCLDLAAQNLQSYIERKVMEKRNLYHLLQYESVNERQAEILRSLIIDNQKAFTINEIQNKFGVVYQTARTDLMGLQDLGYVKEKKFGKKLIFFKTDDFETKLKSVFKHGEYSEFAEN
ncbi:MAG: Fic family protein [Chitinophagales bacterium]|nr:Fic family protein [Chitinophagales bacterium]